jgi:hypothetical protein
MGNMSKMVRRISLGSGFVLSLGTWLVSAVPADAVVYCKTVGVPRGCVARPGVGAGAPGVGVAPANRGGPVNRPGVR